MRNKSRSTLIANSPSPLAGIVKSATDSPLAMEDGWRYVSPGTGELPLVESINHLKADGYAGWLLFEHEKRWHPNLPEPEEIFPAFVDWVRPLIST